MSEPDDAQGQSRVASRIVWVFVGLLFYVLSIGPVEWFFERTHWGPVWFVNFVGIFYIPLAWVAENWKWFGGLLTRYVELFSG